MEEKNGKKILIVDDDPDTVESLSIVLEQEGYVTAGAGSAEEGLAKVASERPDLVLLDVMMPEGTEGFHFVWKLRREADPERRDTPIIVLSAVHETGSLRFYPDQSDGEYGPYEYLPVQGFLDKPASSEAILSEIARVLEVGRSARPAEC